MISKDQVKHVAKLARLKLTDAEIERFAGQLSSIFDYMEVLNDIDTSYVVETSQVTGLENVTEEDEICKKVDGAKLLLSSKLPKERKQILVKQVISQ
ncbi:Asp-tRNA(Asn)/Glu-tRNA(Gln) amidotransferase subunit GatC [Patescibacteria group bacterium]|nr:Asp-tRNA(Asn)/Glu-tRNA(Gln) amidotransferase subunit GatC [Patescibacteria group bacterium]